MLVDFQTIEAAAKRIEENSEVKPEPSLDEIAAHKRAIKEANSHIEEASVRQAEGAHRARHFFAL